MATAVEGTVLISVKRQLHPSFLAFLVDAQAYPPYGF